MSVETLLMGTRLCNSFSSQ